MALSNLENLYKTIIMEHYKNPRGKGLVDGYTTVHLKNPTCGDDIKIGIRLEGSTLKDIRHEGVGCSICCSSASVMCQTLKGKGVTEAKEIMQNFYEIVKGEGHDKRLDMGDCVAYVGVSKFPARIKCATIPWKALEQAIDEEEGND